jgi:anti-sigma regulatory factor (Ser/Thr protein kinase)
MPDRTIGPARGPAVDRITLSPTPLSATAARRFIEARAGAWSLPDPVGEQLVLIGSELVTNALLHARTTLTLTLELGRDRVRVSVEDASQAPATLRRYRSDSLTGRGLGVVASLSHRWGINAEPDGKTVWAELGLAGGPPPTGPRPPEQAPAPSPARPPSAPGAREVRFVGVPVDAYLELQAHNDALFRELELVGIELASRDRDAASVPPALEGLVDRLYWPFRSQRDGHRDVVAAAQARGQQTVDLTTSASPASADAAHSYLELLELADELCRTGVLLTPLPPPHVRSLRRWFVEEMRAQLVHGAPPGRPT